MFDGLFGGIGARTHDADHAQAAVAEADHAADGVLA